ncbi:MAG: hypothetical protein U5R31_08835 [Acidimicrobiia bacterium]|nr:hypothetical protein [Acidimicrobiia bacterium]
MGSPGAPNSPHEATCQAYEDALQAGTELVFADLEDLPAEVEQFSTDFLAALTTGAAEAPPEIRDDWIALRDAWEEIDAILASVGYDVEALTPGQEAEIDAIDESVTDNGEAVTAWAEANCEPDVQTPATPVTQTPAFTG